MQDVVEIAGCNLDLCPDQLCIYCGRRHDVVSLFRKALRRILRAVMWELVSVFGHPFSVSVL
jgi:hypothetical protein